MNERIVKVFDAGAVRANLAAARRASGAEVAAVVKSDAYGAGAARVLPILMREGVKEYFTQSFEEALQARKILGAKARIYIMDGALCAGQFAEMARLGLVPAIISREQLTAFAEFARRRKIKPEAALHFDTGMNRFGLSMREAEAIAAEFARAAGPLQIVLYMTHLADARSAAAQLERFDSLIARLPKARASAVSSHALRYLPRERHYDLARCGAALFGGMRGARPAVSVWARILQVREVCAGDRLGYFGLYTARRAMKIATLAIGYGDGYSRALSHTNDFRSRVRAAFGAGPGFARSYAVIAGVKCPVVGTVSMNTLSVDASLVPAQDLEAAEYAEVMGARADILDFRSANGYIPVELMTDLSKAGGIWSDSPTGVK